MHETRNPRYNTKLDSLAKTFDAFGSCSITMDVSCTETNTSSTESNLCAVCCKTSAVYCPRCRLVGYCSHDHRLQHWDAHDKDCVAVHPVKIKKVGLNKQRALITRNEFKSGAIIFFDTPIIRGPDDNLLSPDALRYCFLTSSKQRSTCITCCSLVLDGRLCSKCQWPVCSQKCSQDQIHSLMECVIFHGQPETQFNIVKPARFVLILRCLLTKETDLKTWNKILSLDTNPMSKQLERQLHAGNSITDAQLKKQQAIERDAITEVMTQLTHFQLQRRFSRNLVARVVNILNWNAIPIELGLEKENMLLYPRITISHHSCTPNALWSMKSTYQLFCHARVDIGVEQALSISRVSDDVLLMSTKMRQQHLRNICVQCNCERCSSPTELDSHFSTVKCINFEFFDPVKGCMLGNLLPEDPCDPDSIWKCQMCLCSRSGKLIQNYMTRIQLELDESMQFVSQLKYKSVNYSKAKSLSDLLGLKKLMRLIKHHEDRTLHKNHSILFHAKCFVIKQLSKGIAEIFNLDISICKKITELLVDAAKLVVQLCDECLSIITIILPGISLRFGEIIYYKQLCLGVILPDEFRRVKESPAANVMQFHEKFKDAKQLRETARFVLSFYKENVEVTHMLEFMTLDEQLYTTVQKNLDQHAPIPSKTSLVTKMPSTTKVTWHGICYSRLDS